MMQLRCSRKRDEFFFFGSFISRDVLFEVAIQAANGTAFGHSRTVTPNSDTRVSGDELSGLMILSGCNLYLARLAMHRIDRNNDVLCGTEATLSDLAECDWMRLQRLAESFCWHYHIFNFRPRFPPCYLLPLISPHCRLGTVLIPLHAFNRIHLL